MSDVEDIVRELGYLALGTRLKRIGERMQAQTQRILEARDVDIPAGQYPFLAALDRLGPQPIGALAEAVGVTQPAATRSIGQLARGGYVEVATTQEDQRRKSVSLSESGKQLVHQGKRSVWPSIEAAVREVAADRRGSLLEQLTAIEEALDERPLDERTGAARAVPKRTATKSASAKKGSKR